ncbi:alpha/beta hydrolase-fold protein [Prescottella equi]|jgi:S-formylglutathione hydrolase FrmB|uniref:LGFP repeat protein n=2 Tax=Rhodococcus hoagii TaxID=43767 RepID=E9T239_RHOHA|nr:alpha/beta hydrolase-fold protein [Prescottella equi]MCD7053353.1 esterase [Rhodococcus sp. BH2-1]EGD23785.1 LGFP repeat protein [Prescottella equi ATCC 33707]MBM4478272.1 esterase [Prescottella equi]MBM4490327.1 esterase [Prescottella equi]MBM4501433.1 esterase [Prescottella equi]
MRSGLERSSYRAGTEGRWRRRALSVAAAALVMPIAAGITSVGTAGAQSLGTPGGTATVQAGAPGTISKVDWLTDRRVAVWVNSPSMGVPIQVQLLLARDWNAKPDAKFPAVYMLDGMRARDDENGWTLETDAEAFYADKNVNVVMPIGGQSSFYADWLDQNNGHNYQWETFLTKELPPILENEWRTTQTRGVVGLSMGGTSAMMLSARNPGFFKFAGSLSGILTTTTLGMPQAISYAMSDAGGYDADAMWGNPTNDAWAAHDPYLLADKLKGMSLYVSSGSGTTGPYDQPSGIPGISTNYAGMGLEILSRLTSQTFTTKLRKLNIPATVNYRPSGTHSWPYWEFELHQLWPQLAQAIGVDADKPGCGVGGAIAPVANGNNWIGDCLTGEYSVPGGVAQDFRFGRIFFSQGSGAQPVAGRIGGAYQGANGPGGALGFPTTPENGTPDGRGRFNHFQKGSIYWTPQTGAHAVSGPIRDEWVKQGYETGPLGYPRADQKKLQGKDGLVQDFEIGSMYWSEPTGTHSVQGLIIKKYGELGWEGGWLGLPLTNEIGIRDFGAFNRFQGGNIYWSPASGAWSVKNGPIFDAWAKENYENGRLGYPISDQFDVPGGVQQKFQHGVITVKDGKATIA